MPTLDSDRGNQTKLRSRSIGRYGEDLAARYLQAQGLALIDRNWRGRNGEIDLVALHDGVLVVCEVKTRTTEAFGGPIEAITPTKLQRLRELASEWLTAHDLPVEGLRIDVVGVRLPVRGRARVEHLIGVS